jgi:hypothetical protein
MNMKTHLIEHSISGERRWWIRSFPHVNVNDKIQSNKGETISQRERGRTSRLKRDPRYLGRGSQEYHVSGPEQQKVDKIPTHPMDGHVGACLSPQLPKEVQIGGL